MPLTTIVLRTKEIESYNRFVNQNGMLPAAREEPSQYLDVVLVEDLSYGNFLEMLLLLEGGHFTPGGPCGRFPQEQCPDDID